MSAEICSWCDVAIADDAGFRAAQPAMGRRAAFCRLEHVVPWAIRGARWDAGAIVAAGEADDALGRCAHCGADLGGQRVLLVRHRGEHRIADAFCEAEHLVAWAKAGGRWQTPPAAA